MIEVLQRSVLFIFYLIIVVGAFGQLLHSNESTSSINQRCNDTPATLVIKNPEWNLSTNSMMKTRDGHFVLAGFTQRTSTPYETGALLVKCKEDGDTVWVKRMMTKS